MNPIVAPVVITALVLGGLAYSKSASAAEQKPADKPKPPTPQANDRVSVPVAKVISADNTPPPVTIPASAQVLVQVTNVSGDQITGAVVGTINPMDGQPLQLNFPVGWGPLAFSASAVTGIWRAGVKL